MHKKTAPLFVHYGEPEKIKKSFAFNVDIFKAADDGKKQLTTKDKLCYSNQGYKTMPKTVGAVLPA